MLRWYYGAEGEAELFDHEQISTRLHLTRHYVADRLHQLVAQLLGAEVVHAVCDRGGTTPDRCRVCRSLPPSPDG
jgi:hypothetical protein